MLADAGGGHRYVPGPVRCERTKADPVGAFRSEGANLQRTGGLPELRL
jgi:hypothetical protein